MCGRKGLERYVKGYRYDVLENIHSKNLLFIEKSGEIWRRKEKNSQIIKMLANITSGKIS